MLKQNSVPSIALLEGQEPSADKRDGPSTSFILAADNFDERLSTFNLLEQLNHLCRGVQRHRGFSIGLLSGNETFLGDFHDLQEQMSRRIDLIVAFAEKSPDLLSSMDIESLYYAWSTIRENWQGDSVLDNFEFHSYFVDQLLVLVSRLTDKITCPYAKAITAIMENGSDEKSITIANSDFYGDLLAFTSRKLPRFIELLGKIRALSVHSASSGYSQSDYDKKLMYLLQCVEKEKIIIFEQTNHLNQKLGPQIPTLLTIKTFEYKLDYFLNKVREEIVEQASISLKEEDIFSMASDIIDIYWRVVDDSLHLLHRWNKNDLEQWLVEGC